MGFEAEHPTHAGMNPPGLSQTVCTEVAVQSHLMTDSSNDLPGLTSLDRLVGLCVEDKRVFPPVCYIRIFLQIFTEGFSNALIDGNFMSLASLLFLDPKSAFDFSFFI